jgi:hypothetical protein
MQRHRTIRRPGTRALLSRRAVLGGLALTFAGGMAGATLPRRVAAAQEATTPAPVAPLGETFVGSTSDPETLVAIVLLADVPGAAVAYLCRGAELNIWFVGRRAGDRLNLLRKIPADVLYPPSPIPTLSGRLDASGITGEAALPDRTLTFTAIPAEGIAGLYVTERDEAGIVLGASSTGATLKARQSAATGASLATAPFQISGTVITAEGRHFELAIPARTDVPAVFRWVALADGSVRGAGRRRPGAGDQFIGQSIELNRSGDGFIGSGVDLNQSDGDSFIESGIDI